MQPGHIFPLQAVDGGVLMRAGHTEAGCDLARMAGWAGLPYTEQRTPYEYGRELGRAMPAERDAIGRIVDAYVSERYSPAQRGSDASLEQDWLSIRKPLLARLFSQIGASARPKNIARARDRKKR